MMNALVKGAEHTSLFDLYATPEEIAHVRSMRAGIAEAIAEQTKISSACAEANHALTQLRRDVLGNARRKAQIAMGHLVDPLPPGPTEYDLQEQVTGLVSLLNDAEEMVKIRQGQFRGAVHTLIRTCAERCAADYYKATQTQAWCHQQIAIAQTLVGGYKPLVAPDIWCKYMVPGSDYLPALKGKAQEEWSVLALASSHRLSVTAQAAMTELRARAVELFGECPL